MSSKRILHVTSELCPYFEENPIAKIVHQLAIKSYKAGNDVRVFMPKFGFINERRFQLHEVIRLSGINLIINDLDQPLVVKVASMPGERMQVYFIDSEEYFKRKTIYHDEKNKFFEDNHERAVFFVKGVLETIKKLNWVPDIIHVHGWMAAFLPIYLKTTYSNDTIFDDCTIISSAYNHLFEENFAESFHEVINYDGINSENSPLLNSNSLKDIYKQSFMNSDLIIKGEEYLNTEMDSFINSIENEKVEYLPLEDLIQYYSTVVKEGIKVTI